MPKQPDIRVVVGAERIESQSVIEQDLKRVAKDISGSNRIPHIAVGIDVNASRALFEKQLKAVAKGLKIEGIKLDGIQAATPPVVNIDTSALVSSVTRAVQAVNALQSTAQSVSKTPIVSAERKNEIKAAADATIMLQRNIASAHLELARLASGQKVSYASATKYIKELAKANESAFAWTDNLNSAEEKYFKSYQKRISQTKEYKQALDDIKSYSEMWNSQMGQGMLTSLKYFKVQGNSRAILKNIVPVSLSSESQKLTDTLKVENGVVDSSNQALREHELQMQKAVDAEAQKAAQSMETARSLQFEEDALEDASEASDEHAKTISVNATKNIKAFEREVTERAKELKRVEGYELESVTAYRDKEDNITGMRLTYNNPNTGAVYQAEYMAKALDDAEDEAQDLNNEMIELEQVSSRIVKHQRDLTAEIKKTVSYRDREANKLLKRADMLYLNSLDPNAKKSVRTEDRADFESDYKAIQDRIAAFKSSSQSIDELKVDINDIIRLLDLYEKKMKASQNAQYAATQLAAKDVTVTRDIQRQALKTLEKNFDNSGVVSESFSRELGQLNADDIVDANSLTKFINQIDILKAKLKTLKAEQKKTISTEKWLTGRLQTLEGINFGATGGKNQLIDASHIKEYTSAYDALSKEIQDALAQSKALTVEEKAGIMARITALRSLVREYQTAEKVDISALDLDQQKKEIDELNEVIRRAVNPSGERFDTFKQSVKDLESKYNQLSEAVSTYNRLKDDGVGDDDLRRQAIVVDNLEREYKELHAAVLDNQQAMRAEAADRSHRSKAYRDAQSLLQKALNFESMNDKFRLDPALSAEYDEIKAKIVAIAKQDIQGKFDIAEIQGLDAELKGFINRLKDGGKAGKTFFGQLQDQLAKLGVYLSGSAIWNAMHQAMRQMLQNVIDLDRAMTELKKVTSATEAAYDRFLSNAAKRAGTLGATLADVVTATADFARLGYNIDQASALADAAIVYKNVGDGITDISVASESIISTMQAFGVEAANAMTIVDKFNEVGK